MPISVRLLNCAFLLVAGVSALLAMDPQGEYFGARTTWQYGLLALIVSVGAVHGLLLYRKRFSLSLMLGALVVIALGASRSDWNAAGASESAIRVFLVPYVIACAYVAAPCNVQVNGIRRVAILSGAWVGISLLAWYFLGYLEDKTQLYHEEVFFLAPLLVASLQAKRPWIGIFALLFTVAAFMASNKFTAIIVLAMALAVLIREFGRSRFWRLRKNMLWTMSGAIALLLFILLLGYYLATSSEGPTGSVDVRGYTYGVRWSQFLAEPFLGGERSGVAGIFVEHKEFTVPSHSDILDVMAFSGIFGTLVFLVPIGIVMLNCLQEKRLEMAALVLAMMATAAFNPFLYQPVFLAFLASAIYFLGGRHASR